MKAIEEAGRRIMEIYEKEFTWSQKEDASEVTQADIAAQEIILAGLKKYNYGFLSEEQEDDLSRLQKEKVWVVDPLDGTRDFIEKNGEFCIMIGLVVRGEPVLGAVYIPVAQKLYFAEKGKGGYVKEADGSQKKLTVSAVSRLSNAHFVMSRLHFSEAEKTFIEDAQIPRLSHSGSVGIKMGLIAEGSADGYINMSNKTHQWDTAAPEVIVKEAGGKVTDRKGDRFLYNRRDTKNEHGVIASNGIIHQQILEVEKEVV